MNNYGTDLQKFLIGEQRTDGWKSDWRKEQEARRKQEMGKRVFVAAPQIKVRQERVRGPHNSVPRECTVCGSGIRRENKTGRCGNHPMEKRLPMRTDYQCAGCDEPIRKTEFGVCKPCFVRYRRLIEQDKVRVCAEPECLYSLNKNNTHTKCRKHSRSERNPSQLKRAA